MSGKTDPVSLLYPDGSNKYTQALYVENTATKYINASICKIIKKVQKRVPGQKIKILEVVLLYAYLLTLARWSEEPQFTVNVTLSSRPYTVRDIEKVVGDFTTNILFDFSASDMKGTIAEQLKFIRNKLYEYCDHSSYEGVEIIRDMIKTGKISQEKPLPIVFTSMLFRNLPNLPEMDVVYSQSQTSQVSLDNQTYKLEDGGLIVWDFIKKIYPETMVEEMFSYYCMVIEQLSKNNGELKCSPAFEKKIKLYNSTEKEIDFFNLGKRLDNIFYKFADKIAITDFEGGITYRELERNIKSTMHDLKKNGIKPGKYVVIKTDKSKESIITILAVVLAGATYVPVEKHWPVERVQYILDNAGADMIIDPYEVCSSNEVNDSWKNIDVESSTYVIYTSGSTGKPKGVEIAYKSMVNTVLDINDRIGLNSSDTILGLSSLCFDLSVYDLFATFFTGAQLKLVKELRDHLANSSDQPFLSLRYSNSASVNSSFFALETFSSIPHFNRSTPFSNPSTFPKLTM